MKLLVLYLSLGKLARHIAKGRQLYEKPNKGTSCMIEPVCLVVGRRLVRKVGIMICSGYKDCLENRSCVGAVGQL